MPNPSTEATPRGVSGVAGFMSVLVFSIINFFLFGKGVILDPFHQGEYFATLPTLLHSQPGAHAFTIHGGLDFIPVWLAETWFGAQHTFLVTQILYGLCNTGAALLLWGTAVLLCPVPKGRARLILLVAVGAVATQVVGYRDLFLLLSLFLFCLHRKVETTPRRLLCEVLLGLAAGFNLFWSYDRGIAGVLAIGSAVLLTLLLQRRHVLSLLSFVATVGWLGFGTDFFALTDYVKNLTFLLETSSQWGYGLSARPLALSLLLAVPTALAGFALIRCLPWPWRWSEDLPLIGALAVLLAIFFKIGVNRADFQHIQMGFWVPLLSLLYAARRQRLARNGGWDISAHPRAAAAAIAAAVLLGLVGLNPSPFFAVLLAGALLAFSRRLLVPALAALLVLLAAFNLYKSPVERVWAQGLAWVPELAALPDDAALATPGVQWASQRLLESGAHCVFDLANNGVINGVTDLPACTKYIYPVYATPPYEADLLSDLQHADPPAVVYSTTFWSFNLNNISMHDKFPRLKAYLDERYPVEECQPDYCLRFKTKG